MWSAVYKRSLIWDVYCWKPLSGECVSSGGKGGRKKRRRASSSIIGDDGGHSPRCHGEGKPQRRQAPKNQVELQGRASPRQSRSLWGQDQEPPRQLDARQLQGACNWQARGGGADCRRVRRSPAGLQGVPHRARECSGRS